MPPSPITALTPKSTWGRPTILVRPCLCIWERRTNSFPSPRKLRSRRLLPSSQTRQSTAIPVNATPSLGIMGRTTMPRRRRSPTGGQANFYINDCGDLRASSRFGPRLRKTNMQTRRVNIQRWSITSPKPFNVVVASVEGAIGRPNMIEFIANMTAATSYEEMQKVVQDSVSEIGLMEFMRLDHGTVLAKAGIEGNPKSVRLIIGNPLTMQSMARLVPDAGSYAPVTVLIDQRPDGVHLSYDEMAALLAPYGNAEALKIARDLDAKVKRLLESAR